MNLNLSRIKKKCYRLKTLIMNKYLNYEILIYLFFIKIIN